MARHVPTAMIFTPCKHGLSHIEAESIEPEEAEAGRRCARMRGFTVSLSGTGLSTQGVIRCDQLRAIDLRARNARRARERVPGVVMNDALAKVGTLFE